MANDLDNSLTAVRRVSFGMYSAFDQAYRTDWPKVISHMKAGGIFNGMTIHLRSPWVWHPDDGPFDAQQFNKIKNIFLAKQNELWFDTLDEVLRLFLSEGMFLNFALFDQYVKPVAGWFAVSPFHDNNYGGAVSSKELYDSIVMGNPNRYVWNEWDDAPVTGKPINFRPVGKLGPVNFAYVHRVMDIVEDGLTLIKTGGFGWKPFNETQAVFKDGHKIEAACEGDRAEIFEWMKQEWAKRGLVKSRRFRSFNDYAAQSRSVTATQKELDYRLAVKGAYGGTINAPLHASALELHNVGEGGHDWQYFRDTLGFDLSKLHLSTDSVMAADGNKSNRDLFNSPCPMIDLKPEEKNWPNLHFTKRNMQKNIIQYHDALVEALQ